MDIILVPGFWLDASSWEEVAPVLESAGHSVHPLTLPGLESVVADRSGIGLRDHVEAVIRAVDSLQTRPVLVGHSGGGAIISAAADARPDKIARCIYVDSGPLGEGGVINDELPADGDDVPLPPWELFEEADLTDLTEELRARFRARAIPQPRGVAQDPQHVSDPRRYNVPTTIIACEFPSSLLKEFLAAGHPFTEELAGMTDVDYRDLPTGHWPQFTRPTELAETILSAVQETRG